MKRYGACHGIGLVFFVLLLWGAGLASSAMADDAATLEHIVTGIEARYQVPGFTAEFDQESVLKAMDVTDTASGRMMVRQPDRMRWEYLTPESQTIIANGNALWIYRPEENQVMKGAAPAFFRDGKGAGFLANVRTIRKNFTLFLDASDDPSVYRLRMVPNTTTEDLMVVKLDVNKADFDVRRVITTNAYGDETRIDLKNVDLKASLPAELFEFTIPPGADVIQMNESE